MNKKINENNEKINKWIMTHCYAYNGKKLSDLKIIDGDIIPTKGQSDYDRFVCPEKGFEGDVFNTLSDLQIVVERKLKNK